MSEWLKETGCKLVGVSLHWFESSSAQTFPSREWQFEKQAACNPGGWFFLDFRLASDTFSWSLGPAKTAGHMVKLHVKERRFHIERSLRGARICPVPM